jgi:hypothetical protein
MAGCCFATPLTWSRCNDGPATTPTAARPELSPANSSRIRRRRSPRKVMGPCKPRRFTGERIINDRAEAGGTRCAQSFPSAPTLRELSCRHLRARMLPNAPRPILPGWFRENFMTKANTDAAGPDRLRRPALIGYSLLLAVLVACGLHALFISGPAARQAAREELVRIIADEDRQFCDSFGLRAASAPFAACSGKLAIIRQKQTDRDNAVAQGVL